MGFDGIQIGERYFNLRCVALSDDPQKAIFDCECGKTGILAYRSAVKSGHTVSCGCARSKALKRRMSDPEHALQIATAASRITNLTHWKTGKTVACQGGYEVAVVEWLNRSKVNYDWQIVFSMPDSSSYRVDLYLPQRDLYVEIKGFWRTPRSKEKWDWFHSTYPNSELWMKADLEKLGIL